MAVHENYDLILSKGAEIVKGLKKGLEFPVVRKGTRLISSGPSSFRMDFSCFSLRLCLRVEFDMPLQESMEPLDVLGSLVLYRVGYDGDDEALTPFPFIGDSDNKTNTLTYNGAGYVKGYKANLSKEMERYYSNPTTRDMSYYANLRDFTPYFWDTLETFVAKSGIRVIPE